MQAWRLLAALTAIGWLGLATASAGSWKYEEDSRDHPRLTYSEDNKTIFMIGCGHAFGLHVRYPGKVGKVGDKASIVISTAKASMTFKGEFEERIEDDLTDFLQWDLGYRRQDPELYGKRWDALRSRLFDLLDSGSPLTISAGSKSYRLPPNDARDWRKRFEACG